MKFNLLCDFIIAEHQTFGERLLSATPVNVKQKDDQVMPTITGIAFLYNGDFLIADNSNSRLTLLDPTFKVKESIKFTGQPWDIAVINDGEVAVTLTASKTLQFYSVSPKLQASRNIMLDGGGYCWSVAVTKDCIYISRNTVDILVLDTDGKPLRSIMPSQTGINVRGLSYTAIKRSGNKLLLGL